jgi:hypothetical protein
VVPSRGMKIDGTGAGCDGSSESWSVVEEKRKFGRLRPLGVCSCVSLDQTLAQRVVLKLP